MVKIRTGVRGRPSHKHPELTARRSQFYIMNPGTFITIPHDCRLWIYDQYVTKKLPLPSPDPAMEEIFYLSLAQREVITTRKWMDFLNGGGGKLLATNPSKALEELGFPPNGKDILNRLASYELQRWCEMYYVAMIREHGKCSTAFYPCYNPVVVNQIAAKYGLVDIPCETVDIFPDQSQFKYEVTSTKAPRKRGRLAGGKTKIDQDGLERIRASLMKCKTPTVIAKELDMAPTTVYASMNDNMFEGKRELTKNMKFHVDTLKRLIPNGEVTWERYVRLHAICETALIKALNKADTSFIYDYNIIPTQESLVYELTKSKGDKKKAAKAFDVPVETMERWIKGYEIGKVILPGSITMRKPETKKSKDVFLDFDKWGIDPHYNPLKGDDKTMKSGDMLR